jgi:arsenate reductase
VIAQNFDDKDGSVTDQKPINVLFLCTHNSARSILAEALLNHLGQGKFKAYSAGSSPRENQSPNPMAIAILENAGISTIGLKSKSWDVFAEPHSPQMDLVVTVCDNAAGEVCPYWPGHPAKAHWGYADPSEGNGSEAEKLAAFAETLHQIKRRLEIFVKRASTSLNKMTLENMARELAEK